jgi:hypothetical protein
MGPCALLPRRTLKRTSSLISMISMWWAPPTQQSAPSTASPLKLSRCGSPQCPPNARCTSATQMRHRPPPQSWALRIMNMAWLSQARPSVTRNLLPSSSSKRFSTCPRPTRPPRVLTHPSHSPRQMGGANQIAAAQTAASHSNCRQLCAPLLEAHTADLFQAALHVLGQPRPDVDGLNPAVVHLQLHLPLQAAGFGLLHFPPDLCAASFVSSSARAEAALQAAPPSLRPFASPHSATYAA